MLPLLATWREVVVASGLIARRLVLCRESHVAVWQHAARLRDEGFTVEPLVPQRICPAN